MKDDTEKLRTANRFLRDYIAQLEVLLDNYDPNWRRWVKKERS